MDLASDLPLYEAIKRDIKSRIESGELAEGTRILPEIELAKQRGVSRSTARKALQSLEQEGLISRTAGRGSFVNPRGRAGDNGAAGAGGLAITVLDIDRYNHSGLCVHGFINTVVTSGFHAVIQPPPAPDVSELDYLRNIRDSGPRGWALWLNAPNDQNGALLEEYRARGGAIVLLDRHAPDRDFDYVATRNEAMAYELTRELLRRGHREVGLIGFCPESTTFRDRIAGYRRAYAEIGVTPEEDLEVIDQIQGLETLRMQILGLLGRRKRPTALFCASADHVSWLLKELQRLEYNVPKDIELATVDDDRFAEKVGFPVLTARQHSYEMGRQAALMLMRRLESPGLPQQAHLLDFDLNFTPGA